MDTATVKNGKLESDNVNADILFPVIRTIEKHNGFSNIVFKIYDDQDGSEPQVGFSIKSRLGAKSTLLNASSATNAVYRLDGEIGKKEIDEFNALRLFQRKFQLLEEKGIGVKYQSMSSAVFEQNLMLIDTMMPDLLAELLLIYYSEPASALAEIIELIEKKNPLGFPGGSTHKFYEFKIKRLLCDIALGMMPARPWSGYYDATGGYVIVKEDGDIVCYHIYNKNQLEEYLLNNTKFETASRSRHNFGEIYSEDGMNYIKLNAQIRFR